MTYRITRRAGTKVMETTATGTVTREQDGPGTELKKLLARFGITDQTGCQCRRMAAKMNRLGPQWCRDNLAEIVAVMEAEAKRRKLPFSAFIAKRLALVAIGRHEDTYALTIRTHKLTSAPPAHAHE